MTNPITTPGGKLLTVVLPENAEKIYLHPNLILYEWDIHYSWKGDDFARTISGFNEHNLELIGTLTLKEGRVEFGGFDPEPFVETEFDTYRDYQQAEELGSYIFNTPQESFLTLIAASNGIYFFNPMGEKPGLSEGSKYDYPHGWDLLQYNSDLAEWQSWEDKLVKTVAVILMK